MSPASRMNHLRSRLASAGSGGGGTASFFSGSFFLPPETGVDATDAEVDFPRADREEEEEVPVELEGVVGEEWEGCSFVLPAAP